METRKQHWSSVYSNKDHTRVSWFQEECQQTLEQIDRLGMPHNAVILDVGGGASRLVDALLSQQYEKIYVLDIAAEGLAISQKRLGEQAAKVQWICADITTASLPTGIQLWHDRAAFHFLAHPEDQRAYVAQMQRSLADNAYVMLATFAVNGPEKCSDLKVEQYDCEKLLHVLGDRFTLLEDRQMEHTTPSGAQQLFHHFLLRYRGGSHLDR